MRADKRAFGLIALVLAPACATSTPFDQHFEANRYEAAVRAFHASPELHDQERALFRAALTYGSPQSPVFDPDSARSLIERLQRLYPNTRYRDEAHRLLVLLTEIQRLEERAERYEREVERLTQDLAELRRHIAWLETRVDVRDEMLDVLRQVIERLEGEARYKDDRIRALQEELERLKEIDLGRGTAPPRVPPAEPDGTAGGPPR
jgi:tetratricopeptide (TPR) repeat protein